MLYLLLCNFFHRNFLLRLVCGVWNKATVDKNLDKKKTMNSFNVCFSVVPHAFYVLWTCYMHIMLCCWLPLFWYFLTLLFDFLFILIPRLRKNVVFVWPIFHCYHKRTYKQITYHFNRPIGHFSTCSLSVTRPKVSFFLSTTFHLWP